MKRNAATVWAIVLLIAFCATGCAGSSVKKEQVELNILAAASLTDVLEEVAGMYQEQEPDIQFHFHFDSSGTLKTQIEQGAPADIFISASMKQMNELDEADLMYRKSIVKLLENEVVLIKQADSNLKITSFEDVATDQVSLVAIGNENVPVGQYTQEIYTNLGLWNSVSEKANLATNVRQVLDWVSTGNADCGIVYATDAAIEKNVVIVSEAPEGTCEKVIYPAGVVKSSMYITEAEAFLEYLATKEVKEVFEKYGFINYEE